METLYILIMIGVYDFGDGYFVTLSKHTFVDV
jgi:hypothetical protein